jgi:glucose-1-phosphate cytidylyltransferase
MVFKKQFLDFIKPGSMVEEAFVPLIQKQELSVFEHEGSWKSMDTYKDVEELNIFWERYPFWKVW